MTQPPPLISRKISQNIAIQIDSNGGSSGVPNADPKAELNPTVTKLSSAYPKTPTPIKCVWPSGMEIQGAEEVVVKEARKCYSINHPNNNTRLVAEPIGIETKLSRDTKMNGSFLGRKIRGDLEKSDSKSDVIVKDGVKPSFVMQSHLVLNMINNKKETTTFDNKSRQLSQSKDSPSLKALKRKNAKEVREKVIEIENCRVKRNEVSLSPNKMKLKKVSENIKNKMSKYDEIKSRNQIDKMDKIENPKKIVKLKEIIEDGTATHSDAVSKENTAFTVLEKRNAFEIMLESAQGGIITPKMHRKSVKKKAALKTPLGTKSDIRRWVKKDREI